MTDDDERPQRMIMLTESEYDELIKPPPLIWLPDPPPPRPSPTAVAITVALTATSWAMAAYAFFILL